ncbi:MAG: hypothetical protein U0516_00490 [Candidatus Saccharibacteria bacterium]
MNIKNVSINTLKWLIAIFYISALSVQFLVLLKVIPYYWVNGGKSASYESQLVQSLISIVIIFILYIFVWKLLYQKGLIKKWKLRALYVITFFWLLGFLMQLAGTEFERYFLSLFLLLGVVSHGMLVLRARSIVSL